MLYPQKKEGTRLADAAGNIVSGLTPGVKEVIDVPENFVGLIEEVGQACFGPQWRNPMSKALGTTVRTINRWRSGQVALTEELMEQYGYVDKLSRILDTHCRVRRRALERQLQDHEKKTVSARTQLEKLQKLQGR